MTKENSIKMKKRKTMWENIFANDTSDKGLISKIYKELTQFHCKQPNKKMGKGLEQTLFQGGHTKDPEAYERVLSVTSHRRVVS